MIIYTRSPYFITVDEASQIGSKIELRIWNGTGSAPTGATYVLSKSIASTTQRKNSYNISPYIREYIENVAPIYTADKTDSVNMWANVEVKRYKETSIGVYSLLNTTTYLGVCGYTLYTDGYNFTNASNDFIPLTSVEKDIRYNRDGVYPYINVLINPSAELNIIATYKDLSGSNVTNVNYTSTKGLLKVPVTLVNSNYDNGNTLTIKYTLSAVDYTFIYRIIPVCEPKYTPAICSFINRYGGWEFLTFFKTRKDDINVKGSNYNLLPDTLGYNYQRGQSKSFNLNGKQTVKLNTGFVPENYSSSIQDLLLSETILLNGLPVELKTQNANLKTSLNDKNINYELDFEYSYNLINNVI